MMDEASDDKPESTEENSPSERRGFEALRRIVSVGKSGILDNSSCRAIEVTVALRLVSVLRCGDREGEPGMAGGVGGTGRWESLELGERPWRLKLTAAVSRLSLQATLGVCERSVDE